MPWRETFIRRFGPGMLGGISFRDWLRLLRANRFAVAPTSLWRALAITSQSLQNSLLRCIENRRYAAKVADIQPHPPLFILGHWRSGTTHLHNLLTLDDRFTFPNNYQALFPHAFLTAERTQSPFIQWFLSPRRPMDNIEWTMNSPQEDEFALCILTALSPCTGWFFPSNRDHYDRYLTFNDVPAEEIDRWKHALLLFLKRLTFKSNRPVILKSPPHTARIRLLLELFPDARFIHIRRDPFTVFLSTRHMLTINLSMHRLQRPPAAPDLDDWIIRQYRAMYDAYFQQRELIPPGHLCEISYEDLDRDPLTQTRLIYESLNLPEFAHVQPLLEQHVRSLHGYQKNRFPDLPPDLRRRIAEEWRLTFNRWDYPT